MQNCHSFTKYRLGYGESKNPNYDQLVAEIIQRKKHIRIGEISFEAIKSNPEKYHKVLCPGDVLLFDKDHSAVVTTGGRIDHMVVCTVPPQKVAGVYDSAGPQPPPSKDGKVWVAKPPVPTGGSLNQYNLSKSDTELWISKYQTRQNTLKEVLRAHYHGKKDETGKPIDWKKMTIWRMIGDKPTWQSTNRIGARINLNAGNGNTVLKTAMKLEHFKHYILRISNTFYGCPEAEVQLPTPNGEDFKGSKYQWDAFSPTGVKVNVPVCKRRGKSQTMFSPPRPGGGGLTATGCVSIYEIFNNPYGHPFVLPNLGTNRQTALTLDTANKLGLYTYDIPIVGAYDQFLTLQYDYRTFHPYNGKGYGTLFVDVYESTCVNWKNAPKP